jgi:heat shock protein HslJ/uncharacterized lipoprotein YbaY
MIRCLVPAFVAAALAAPSFAQETREIMGEVTYLPRIALAPDATLIVEARGPGNSELGFSRQPTEGAQVPLPFSVEIPEGPAATLRVGFTRGGQLRWISEPVEVEEGTEDVDVGEVIVRQFTPMGFASAFRCGDRLIQVGFAGDDVVMETGEARIRMEPSRAASGARYEAPDAPGTWFWSQDDSALVAIDGEELPECHMVFPMTGEGYTARGNEPFWNVTVAGGRMEIVRLGFDDLDLPVTSTELTAEGNIVIEAHDRDEAVRAVLVRKDGLCNDSMSGMPYPEVAELSMGDNVMTGCGGDPQDLLTGRDWVVEDIGGQGVIDESRVTLSFGEDGRVSGSGGCNRWFADYELTGEGLSFGQAGSTMMACPEALMNQERRFFDALGEVFRHDFDETGALVLYTPDGAAIRARAEG